MDVLKAIQSRYTVRAFKPIPVSREIIEELLATAIRAPSWANTQTWEFAIVGGEIMAHLKQALVTKALSQCKRNPDIPRPNWPSPYNERSSGNKLRLHQLLGISYEDHEKELQWFTQMCNFFDAHTCIIIYTDKGLSEWSLFNIGLLVENVTLAACKYGLGTAISNPKS